MPLLRSLYCCMQETDAIFEIPENIGTVTLYKTGNEDEIAEGRLKVGSAKQTIIYQAA
jgi:hypothetical protein